LSWLAPFYFRKLFVNGLVKPWRAYPNPSLPKQKTPELCSPRVFRKEISHDKNLTIKTKKSPEALWAPRLGFRLIQDLQNPVIRAALVFTNLGDGF